jgi:uncharacterized phage-associated protein
MASVLDVAAYILRKRGGMSAMKLQKLVYYSQAWATVWDDEEIFPESIRAWKNGPVVRELWEEHRGQFRVSEIKGHPSRISEHHKETIDSVLDFYGDKSAQWLSDLTHMEDPWKEAYTPYGDNEITLEALSEYYSSLKKPGG